MEILQLLLLYFYNSDDDDDDEDEKNVAAADFVELLKLFQTHGFGRKVNRFSIKFKLSCNLKLYLFNLLVN